MSLCFNKSYTALVTSTPEGYKLFDLLDSIYPDFVTKLKRNYVMPQGKIHLIGDLLDNLFGVMVLENRPKELILWDFDNKTGKNTFSYQDDILTAKMSSTFIIVFFMEKILIHDHSNESRFEICMPSNPKGVGDFVSTKKISRLAYPDGIGAYNLFRVRVTDVESKRSIVSIDALEHPVAMIAFSPSGVRIAITCEKGNEIFVFNSQTGAKLDICVRGITNVAISSIVFSKNELYLASSSNSGTVHVFQMSSLYGNLTVETDSDERFPIKLPEGRNGAGSICGIKSEGKKFRLMVTLPPHSLYVHYIPDFWGESNGSYKLYDLLKIEETEMVQFSSSGQTDDAASGSAIVESTV